MCNWDWLGTIYGQAWLARQWSNFRFPPIYETHEDGRTHSHTHTHLLSYVMSRATQSRHKNTPDAVSRHSRMALQETNGRRFMRRRGREFRRCSGKGRCSRQIGSPVIIRIDFVDLKSCVGPAVWKLKYGERERRGWRALSKKKKRKERMCCWGEANPNEWFEIGSHSWARLLAVGKGQSIRTGRRPRVRTTIEWCHVFDNSEGSLVWGPPFLSCCFDSVIFSIFPPFSWVSPRRTFLTVKTRSGAKFENGNPRTKTSTISTYTQA